MNHTQKGAPIFFNSFLRYKTSVLRCSPKKFKSIAYELKKLTLNQAIDLSSASRKYVSFALHKDLYAIRANLLNVLCLSLKIVDKMRIGFVVIESGKLKRRGTRFKARGRGSRSETSSCVACIYLKNNSIEDFNSFIKSHIENKISDEKSKIENKVKDSNDAKENVKNHLDNSIDNTTETSQNLHIRKETLEDKDLEHSDENKKV